MKPINKTLFLISILFTVSWGSSKILKILIGVFFLLFAGSCYCQELVDFKLLETKETVQLYFETLAIKAHCEACVVKKQVDVNGNLVLGIEFPTSERYVMATAIWATFFYDKKKDQDLCFNIMIAGGNKNVSIYLDMIRKQCDKNEKNEWEFDTGRVRNEKKVFFIYKFNDQDVEMDECCYTLRAFLVTK